MPHTMKPAFALALLATPTALGANVIRGHDQNPGGGALASFPNSSGAEAQFFGAAGEAGAAFDFESLSLGAPPSAWDFGVFSAAYTSTATLTHSISTGLSGVDTYPVNGTNYLYTETQPGSTFFTLMFDTDLRAFGTYVCDASDWFGSSDVPGPLFFDLLDASANVLATFDLTAGILPSDIRTGGMSYFGVIADAPFRGVRLSQPLRPSGASTLTDGIGIDVFTAIPVPAPGAGIASVLCGIAVVPRRRR